MYLKTLELQGFKSFPDKTVISFEPGITAIVGANGSGKSNISDAVRWVLGEMSPKSLRSGKMEDVIFNGTAKRKPSNFAEVILTIDNTDQLMKIDYDEVSVSRRLYRSGESEYTINKQKSRLKDVVDLFLNTGIGREGYSIISQGRISEILSVKGSDRRDIFEEAAGISRFRYRKTEANNKLSQISENAQRIGDILSEVEARLPSLARQSEKAVKFLELAEEKRKLEIAFWAQRLKVIEAKEAQMGEQAAKENKTLSEITDALVQLEAKLDEVYVQTQKETMLSSQLSDTIREHANEKSEIASRLSVLENDIFHFTARWEASHKESQARTLQREAALKEKEALDRSLEEQTAATAQALALLEESGKALDLLNAERNELLLRQDQLLMEKQRLEDQLSRQEMSRMEKKGFGDARRERIRQIDREMETRRLAVEKRAAALAEAKQRQDTLSDELDELLNQRDDLRALQTECASRLSQADNAKRDLDLQLLSLNQRKETLTRMERLLEGFSGSVKEVMNAFERGELTGIFGPVSRLIQTDERYITAVETALGAGIQNVVVENERAAKAAIEFLKRTRSGRATFLPLTTVKPNVTDLSSVRHPGLIGNAVDLVKFDKKFAPAIEFLLGRTAVAESIDAATGIASSRAYSLRVVTLDGQIINAGGSFTGGQQLHKTGILSRTADLAKLEEESNALKKKLAVADDEVKELLGERDRYADKLRRLADRIDQTKSHLTRSESEVRMEEELMENMRLADEALLAEMQSLKEAGADQQALMERLNREQEQLTEEKAKNDTLLNGVAAAIRAANTKKEEMIAENTRLATEMALKDAQSNALKKELAEWEQEQLREKEKELSMEEERHSLEQRIEESKQQIAKDQVLLQQATQEMEQSQKQLEDCRVRLALLEKDSFDDRARQKDLTLSKDKQNDVCTTLKIQLENLSNEKETLFAKLFEEYELGRDSEEFALVPEGEAERLGGEIRLIFLRKEIKKLGNVNTDSVEEYKTTKERADFLRKQYDDVVTSQNELEKLVLSLEKTMREMFVASFEKIRSCFKETFTQLFGGGSADIVLTDKEDILNCGIEIQIQPPGKLVKNLTLLSGGEQAFVAIALYFAILKVNPTPFCIFDEIESALDEANIYRFADYLKKNCDKTQFVVITHRRGTMEFANVLYGITMQEKGVSDFIRLDTAALEMFQTE